MGENGAHTLAHIPMVDAKNSYAVLDYGCVDNYRGIRFQSSAGVNLPGVSLSKFGRGLKEFKETIR
jgi:hypothetical protein